MLPVSKVVSGGQTGVDRGVLEAALWLEEQEIKSLDSIRMTHGGWCPLGRRAQDGIIPTWFQLQETPSEAYEQRTEWNVRDSDGTLILYHQKMHGGTLLTYEFTQQYHRPVLTVDLSRLYNNHHPDNNSSNNEDDSNKNDNDHETIPKERTSYIPTNTPIIATNETTVIESIRQWLIQNQIQVLNVAGPRENDAPGIQQQSKEMIIKLFFSTAAS